MPPLKSRRWYLLSAVCNPSSRAHEKSVWPITWRGERQVRYFVGVMKLREISVRIWRCLGGIKLGDNAPTGRGGAPPSTVDGAPRTPLRRLSRSIATQRSVRFFDTIYRCFRRPFRLEWWRYSWLVCLLVWERLRIFFRRRITVSFQETLSNRFHNSRFKELDFPPYWLLPIFDSTFITL